jgi:hypothetical protein
MVVFPFKNELGGAHYWCQGNYWQLVPKEKGGEKKQAMSKSPWNSKERSLPKLEFCLD